MLWHFILCVCVCACVRACVRACVSVCSVYIYIYTHECYALCDCIMYVPVKLSAVCLVTKLNYLLTYCTLLVEDGHHLSRARAYSTYCIISLQTDFNHIRPVENHGTAFSPPLHLSSARQTTVWIAYQRPICVQVNRLDHSSTHSHATGDNGHVTTISIRTRLCSWIQ